jgi:septal ring factor EnvC (AmiA/AmiB activator)
MVPILHKPTPIEKLIVSIGSIPSLIAHTLVFAGFFLLSILGIVKWELMLLILTTALSLEAIYLAIFIQMTVNRNTQSLKEVEKDIDEIQEDVDEIQEDVEELGEDVDEIQEDIEEISEDIEELSEEDAEEEKREEQDSTKLEQLTSDIRRILVELETLKKK